MNDSRSMRHRHRIHAGQQKRAGLGGVKSRHALQSRRERLAGQQLHHHEYRRAILIEVMHFDGMPMPETTGRFRLLLKA